MVWQGFFEDGFTAYLNYEFSNFCYMRELVQNLIDYAYEHQHSSKDQFCAFLAELIPEVEFGEVSAFMEDGYLTAAFGIPEKRRVMTERSIQVFAEDQKVIVNGEELTL